MINNIYKRKDGRFEGRIPIYNSDESRKYKYFFGKTKEEVIEKISKYRESLNTSEEKNITFCTAYTDWFRSVAYRIKESTAANYILKADKHILPYFGDSKISDITSASIYQFICDKQDNGLSNRYISDILILMKSVFKFASRKYHTPNPMEDIVMPKKQKSNIRLLTNDEEQRLMWILKYNLNLTSIGIILARMTGLRIGELCALQWKDINLDLKTITISKTIQRIQTKNGNSKTKLVITEPKSETSKRVIPIPDCIIEILTKFKASDDDYILSGNEKPVEPRVMQYRFAKILKNGNLPSVHFHALRHSFASCCIKLGFDIKALSEILGHSSVEITLNRYVHSSFEQKAEYMKRLEFAV